MDSSKTDLVEKIKAASTVLVTVSRNPSIDQLAACIGFALILSKLKKHATAVFSGQVPSTIEFLRPEETLEKTTNSLRDFIIALDKSKADKLRYKIEDQTVKIFITPYRTSLSESDLEFSQGDFNVDLIVTLGVEKSEDLDQAITASGNILHDATIVGISANNPSTLGSINWNVSQASSLCELVAELASSLGTNLFDQQIATALLTGVVAETERFSNDKTTSLTMSVSSQLMAAGANQQLVANELAEGNENNAPSDQATENNGELEINHKEDEDGQAPDSEQPITIPTKDDAKSDTETDNQPRFVSEPPQLGGTLTANSSSNNYEPSTDPLSNLGGGDSMNALYSKPPDVPGLPQQSGQTDDTSTPSPTYTPPPTDWMPHLEDKALESKVDKELADPTTKISNIDETIRSSAPANESQTQESASKLKDQLNKLIPQEGVADIAPPAVQTPPPPPPAPVPPPPPPKPAGSSSAFPDVLDPKDLQPPDDPKAPPYPPPIVAPPEAK